MSKASPYREDIDGLRAISVLVILLFHLQLPAFEGGFIGVDVFFVVSGFLITALITAALEEQQFSFRDFYVRRIARLLPALIVVVALSLLAATYIQQPDALIHTAKQSLAAIFSVSNVFFWLQASYWAPAAENYALLHTWSLGVEEQFYLVYPVILVLCFRFGGKRGVVGILVLITLVSFYGFEQHRLQHATATFYLTPYRMYEFSIGGLAALLRPRLSLFTGTPLASGLATILGIALVLFSTLALNEFSYLLNAYLMWVPLTGAVLTLLAGPSPVAAQLLQNRVMLWLGKTSYSIYLVHWPIITLYRYLYGASLSYTEQVILLIVILACSELLCRFVERGFRLQGQNGRTAFGFTRRRVLQSVAISLLAVTGLSALLQYSGGLPGRIPPEARSLLALRPAEDMGRQIRFLERNCLPYSQELCGERDPQRQNILLLGDSRALDLYVALRHAYPQASVRASYAMGCAPVFSSSASISHFFADCASFNKQRLQKALESPDDDIIFLAQAFNQWRNEAIVETVATLREAGKQVWVLGDFRMIKQFSPIEITIDQIRFKSRFGQVEDFLVDTPFALDETLGGEIEALGARYISNKPFFFDGQYRFSDATSGELYTNDGKHLTNYGAARFGDYLRIHHPLPK
jgi:peptidoglycan/LPS O-acetylase OafA/YrhL